MGCRAKYKSKNFYLACNGDLKHYISIKSRNIVAPYSDSPDFTEDFPDAYNAWAAIETKNGITVFDGTNTERIISHIFIIRHIDNLTAEYWIYYKDRAFDILKVEPIDEWPLYTRLYCVERGTKDLPVNDA